MIGDGLELPIKRIKIQGPAVDRADRGVTTAEDAQTIDKMLHFIRSMVRK